MSLDYAGATTTGLCRERNEDRGGQLGALIFGVFDGMGSYGNGAEAATAAMEGATCVGSPHEVVVRMRRANTLVQLALRGAKGGTTGTIVGLSEPANLLYLAHVGDSRAYRFRAGKLVQLTTDHNPVWLNAYVKSADGARIMRDELRVAANSAKTHVLSNYLGDESPFIETDTRSFVPGDTVVLFTDGLMPAGDTRIADIVCASVARSRTSQLIAESLCNEANRCGGRDNTTVVVVQWSR